MATKPTDGHIDWISDDDASKYAAPSASKRLQGWMASEKPPFQYFNWLWRLVDRWLQWAEAQSDENVAAINTNAQAISANAQAISTESDSRAQADSTLQQNINTEATTRGSADTGLQQNIDTEATARQNADTSLQQQIDNITPVYTSFAPGGDFTGGTIYLMRIGKRVTMRWTGLTHASTTEAVSATNIPAGYRAATDLLSRPYFQSNAANLIETISIDASGSRFYIDYATFTAGNLASKTSAHDGSITWLTA